MARIGLDIIMVYCQVLTVEPIKDVKRVISPSHEDLINYLLLEHALEFIAYFSSTNDVLIFRTYSSALGY